METDNILQVSPMKMSRKQKIKILNEKKFAINLICPPKNNKLNNQHELTHTAVVIGFHNEIVSRDELIHN